MIDSNKLREQCETLGIDAVKKKLREGSYRHDKKPIIEEWLKEKDECVTKTTEEEKINLKRESNEIAKLALNESKIAKYFSLASIIIAIIAAAISYFK